MNGFMGVAISTTGDEHRLGFLETCVRNWYTAIARTGALFVTVDGDAEACERARKVCEPYTRAVYRVGQRALDPRHHPDTWYAPETGQRLGVAVNKNTGIELLMNAEVEHLFLSDDDTWPVLGEASLLKHVELGIPHSMVCWGHSRLNGVKDNYAKWSWPRGVMLYTQRSVIGTVGGMDERFGPGGHEHVEWSRRIHQAGFTPDPYISPASYAERGEAGIAMQAATLWNCEDMRRPGENGDQWGLRKKRNTSIRRSGRDWAHIDKIMTEREGDTSFVAFRAHANGRASATLCSAQGSDLTGLGAGGAE